MAKLPNFIIIGAGKAGTSSLRGYLRQHPEIYLCPTKETFYFLNQQVRINHRSWGAVQTFEAYSALFEAAPLNSIVGEISTIYYAHADSAALIHEALPDVKILAILRNPIDRAFSSYQMHVNNGREKRAFKDVINLDIKYVKRGFYSAQLKPYFNIFDSSQIKVFLYDDYCQDSASFIESIFEFIGVDSQFVPDTSKRARVGGVPKRRWVRNLLAEKNWFRTTAATALKTVMPLEARQSLRSQLLQKNTARIRLDADSRQQLAEIYREDIAELQTLLGRDLSHWLKPSKTG
ncbi:MAG: sulfotransferase [Leptolyngbya sp. SIO1E4]|nr:sulfotransferase [Leptolyngbya sp. SIO1E4]